MRRSKRQRRGSTAVGGEDKFDDHDDFGGDYDHFLGDEGEDNFADLDDEYFLGDDYSSNCPTPRL